MNIEYIFTVGTVLVAVLAILILIRVAGVVRYVPNSGSAVVERLWSHSGSLESGVIALKGEAGFLPELLRGGFHFFLPFTYRLRHQPLVTIGNGEIGYVYARSGAPLPPSQTLASNATANRFEDVRHFLESGGQKGPQRLILRGGVHAINMAAFSVLTKERVYSLGLDAEEDAMLEAQRQKIEAINGFDPVVIDGLADQIGIVTTHDGPDMPSSALLAPTVGVDVENGAHYHHAFQDPDAFVRAGGLKGRQEQVLVEGTYYLNRMFATVEFLPKTIIPIGHVGVVVAYTGREYSAAQRQDASLDGTILPRSKHGELVPEGFKGVRERALPPGKFAWNPYSGTIVLIQTTNLILVWAAGEVSAHKLDANLKEVSLITSDAFEPILPLSVVLHIDPAKAPRVVQRFGDLAQLVNETIDPLVSSWFKDTAQTKNVLDLIRERKLIQDASKVAMKEKFASYDIELVDVLTGTPRGDSIEPILAQLRDRQIATEQVDTYKAQRTAADHLRDLKDAQAKADSQGNITRSRISVEVAQNDGDASVRTAQKEAERIKVLAAANADANVVQGEAEGKRLAAIGSGEAAGIEAKVKAAGGAQYGLVSSVMAQFAKSIENGKVAIVPHTLVTSGDGSAGGGNALMQLFQALLAQKLPLQEGQAQTAGEACDRPDA